MFFCREISGWCIAYYRECESVLVGQSRLIEKTTGSNSYSFSKI